MYKQFTGTIASVSALGLRDDNGDLYKLQVSVLTVVSAVDGKILKSPIWVSTIMSAEEAASLGLVIKAKSLNTPRQLILNKELNKFGLSASETGTMGTFSFKAIGVDALAAREIHTPGRPPQMVYPASGAHEFELELPNGIITEFETVENVNQTSGYRPPNRVLNYLNRQAQAQASKTNPKNEITRDFVF